MIATLSFCLLLSLADDVTDRFKIATRRANDIVKAEADNGVTTLDIQSPFGISRTEIEPKDGGWPKTVKVRLHLKGLENFQISNGKTTLTGAVSVQNGKTELRLWRDRNEAMLLDEKSSLWIRTRIVGNDTPALPLMKGAFELTLPAAFFTDSPKTIAIEWIDFYR